jgi:DNA-binding transcriptional MerR regulator
MGNRRKAEGLSTAEAAALVGASVRQLSYWASRGYIPGLRPGGSGRHLRWLPSHVAAARMVRARLKLARLAPVDQQEGRPRMTA